MTDDLIELVRQRKIIYDSKCKEYKDQLIRNAAWEEIAEILKEPVNKCKDEWTKLRNAFASALKRRRYKKSGQAAAALAPWKHEESMGFLLPYMECRNTKTNVPTPESPPTEDSLDESLPASPSPSTRSQSQSSSSRGKTPKLQELYDLMKSSQDLRRQKHTRQDMDETDLFFLSMSKEVKKLPKIDQTKIKLDLHTAISQAVIRQLEQQSTPQHIQSSTYIQTPADVQAPTYIQSPIHAQSPTYIKLSPFPTTSRSQKHAVLNSDDSKRVIQSTPQHQSTYIQTPADVQAPTYIQSPIHAQSPTYIKLSSFPTTSRSQKHAVSNSDDSKRVIQSTPQHQSSTSIQTPADVQAPTPAYIQSPIHAQSPTYIKLSSFPTTSRSQKHAVSNSDDSKRVIQSTPQHQSSTSIQTPADVQAPTPTYIQSPIHAQSPTYIKLSSFPTTSRSQKHAFSNSDDSKRVIQSTPQHQSSTSIQTPADIQAPTYIQSPIHAQSPIYIKSSSFPSRLNSKPVISDDLKAYYDSINFSDDELENDG